MTSATDVGATNIDAHDADVVLRALRGEGLAEFDALARRSDADHLRELGASEHGQAWTNVPRHVVPNDHRLVILHAAARMYRYDGDALHLDGDVFQAIVACLERGETAWAEQAGHLWRQLVMHAAEWEIVWPHASSLLERFEAQLDANPGLLASVATIASMCGAPEAGSIWARVLRHPSLGDDAVRRWKVEFDWARTHLLLGGGEPGRAMQVLQRVRKGFGDLATSSAQLTWTDATLELVIGLTWLGRSTDALRLVEDSLRRVEPGSELEVWLRASAGYPTAVGGDRAGVRAAEAALAEAQTDVSIPRLRILLPARAILAAHDGDSSDLHAIAREADVIESQADHDPEARLDWRIHALESAAILGDHEFAESALRAIDAILDEVPYDLPGHRIRRDLAAHVVHGTDPDGARRAQLEDAATRIGMFPPDLTRAVVDARTSASADHVLGLQLLGPFDVLIDGVPIDERTWSGRRQARVLLAMLVVRGGRMQVDTAIDALWGDIDPTLAMTRLKPLGAAIRNVLNVAGAATPPRELEIRGGSIVLRLHQDDHDDLGDLRDALARVEREPARSRDVARDALARTGARPISDLGTDRAADELRVAIEAEVASIVPRLAAAWDGRPAPEDVIAAVRRVAAENPTDSEAAARLMRLLADAGDVPAASAVFHDLRAALRDELGLDPTPAIVRLHGQIVADERT